MAGAERVFEMLDQAPEIDEGTVELVGATLRDDGTIEPSRDGAHPTHWAWRTPVPGGLPVYTQLKGDVRFDNVTFGYHPDQTVLHDVSLFAKPGQKIAFVGSTGAGKTTITNLINRFYEIKQGSITFDGIDITQDPQRQPAQLHRHGAAGHASLHRHGHGEHPLRPAGRHRRGVHRWPPSRPTPTPSSSACRRATRPRSLPTERTCRRASASSWPSPAPPSPTRRCWSWTRPPAPSTRAPSA